MIFFKLEFEQRLKNEFYNVIDNRLRIILYALSAYVKQEFLKDITITDLFRTEEEQKIIYKTDNPPTSVHQLGRGADIRVANMTDEIKNSIVNFLNTNFEYDSIKYKTSLIHDIAGLHLHIQVDNNEFTKIVK